MKTKRLLAVLLTLALMAGILPVSALAADAAVDAEWAAVAAETEAIVMEPVEDMEIPEELAGDALSGVGDHKYSETEPNDSLEDARVIYNDYTVIGSIKGYDLDFFTFTLTKKSEITILVGAERSGLSFLLMDSYGEGIAAPSYTDVDSLYYDGLAGTLNAGTYYLALLDMNAENAYYSSFDYILYFEAVPVATSHTHSYTAKVTKPTCTAQGYTTYTCSCGSSYKDNYVAATGHSYDAGVVTVAPTADSTGVKTYTCTKCGATKTETLPAVDPRNPFVDVIKGRFYYEPVLWAVENGITAGTSKTTFEPDATCTRGQVVTFLWRAAGSPAPTNTSHPFTDVRQGAYYYKAMLWAVENGITAGTSKTKFSPDEPCTRSQVVTFLYRAAGKPAVQSAFESSVQANPVADENSAISCYEMILQAVEDGILAVESNPTFEADFEPGDVIADVGDHEYSETEPNNSQEDARIIYSDYTVYGSIAGYDLDFFTFTLTKKSEITILVGAERSGLSFLLMDAAGEGIAAPSYTDVDSLYYDGLAGTLNAGTYYLALLDMDAETAYYSSFDYILYFEATPVASSHTHSYTAKVTQPTCTEKGYTTYTCSCGSSYKDNYVNATGHSYNSGVVTVEPTANSTGVKTYTCTKCGHTKTETIPAVTPESPFVDVSTKAYYYKAVLWAVENGITSGTSKTKFSPDDPCTRGQVVTFLYRFYK